MRNQDVNGVFPKQKEKLSEFIELAESDKINDAWIGVNLKILFVTGVLVAVW